MYINNRSHARQVQSGFTIVELIIFIVIVSAAVAGILTVMNITTAHSADPQIRKQALSIAEALIEEVSQFPFTCDAPVEGAVCTGENGVGSVDSRLKVNSGTSVAINDINDNPIPALANYNATVTIQNTNVALGPAGSVNAGDALHIIVIVTNGSESIQLDGYRTRYMPGTDQ